MRIVLVAGLLAVAMVGCGGEKRITGKDKAQIAQAALTISHECILGGSGANVSKVEDSVTTLLDARDEFGDQRFTLSREMSGVTVQDIIDGRAKLMDDENCAPEQRDRMS